MLVSILTRILICTTAILASIGLDTAVFGQPIQTRKVTFGNSANDRFGRAVAIDGDTAIVGAPGNGSFGSAHLIDVTTGDQIASLFSWRIETGPGSLTDRRVGNFGRAVDIDSGRVIVGAVDFVTGGTSVRGDTQAYVFDASTGERVHKLKDDLGGGFDQIAFGDAVAINSSVEIVGAPQDGEGTVTLFDPTDLSERTTVDAGEATFRFGDAVAISGDTAIVGTGAHAYLLDVSTGEVTHKLEVADLEINNSFTPLSSVAIDGDLAAVGLPLNNHGNKSGTVHLFDINTGQLLRQLIADDSQEDDRFGWSIGISGEMVVVGAPHDDNENGSDAGSVYLFDAISGRQLFKMTADDGRSNDEFGRSLGISGSNLVVGAPFDDDFGSSSGAAYFFDLSVVPEPSSAVIYSGLIFGLAGRGKKPGRPC